MKAAAFGGEKTPPGPPAPYAALNLRAVRLDRAGRAA
jgi:hypothetical protein